MNHAPHLKRPDVEIHGVTTVEEAVELVEAGAKKAVKDTENVVRRYPLRAMGVALGTGAVLGVAVGALLASPRRQPSMLERLGSVAVFGSAVRAISALFR